MQVNTQLSIVEILQSAITPVTLLTGVAFLTSILAPRFGRCIDRIRIILQQIKSLQSNGDVFDNQLNQLKILYARTRQLRNTMIAAGLCILFVVITIFITFSHLLVGTPGSGLTVVTFILSLCCLLFLTIGFIYDFMVSLKAVKLEIKNGVGDTIIKFNE